MKYCIDDQHTFKKVVSENNVTYLCLKCSYIKGYIKPKTPKPQSGISYA